MFLDNISYTLESLGYHINPYGNIYLRVARKSSGEEPMFINTEDFFCRVYLEEDQLRLVDFKTQIPDDKYFNSEAEMIAYIKKEFPLQRAHICSLEHIQKFSTAKAAKKHDTQRKTRRKGQQVSHQVRHTCCE